jgi:hypothetical protein
MSKNTTMKLSKRTLKRLHKLAGEIAAEKGKRVTLEDALIELLEEKEAKKISIETSITKDDREAFKALLDLKFTGGCPEDYKEYNYEDVGTG